jgi:predicted acetyltransferase
MTHETRPAHPRRSDAAGRTGRRHNGVVAHLSLPTSDVRESFLVAIDELRAEGRGGPDDQTMMGREIREWSGRWESPDGLAAYVAALRSEALEETTRPEGFVPSTTWWWVDGPDYFGRIALRHRLTPWLREVGGHIGYDVRPSARRVGNATAMLGAVLPEAHAMGIDPALLTCDVDNVGSRRAIEANGGVLEDERGGKLRFWVPTGATMKTV